MRSAVSFPMVVGMRPARNTNRPQMRVAVSKKHMLLTVLCTIVAFT